MTTSGLARKHHFVPKFLLRPWLVCAKHKQQNLHGYWWDHTKGKLRCKSKGLNAFCFQVDLLSLKAHSLGRDALERLFFGEVDAKGASVRDILVDCGPEGLTEDQRCDFARLLLSLDARRPCNVNKMRTDVADCIARGIDADPDIHSVVAKLGIDDIPSNFAQNRLGLSFEDCALTSIQKIVDNPKVGGRLINANWAVKRLAPRDGSLVLSDRPLIRICGYDSPGATWVLPLNPNAAFFAANHEANLRSLLRLTGQRFVKAINVYSARQAEKFVFSTEERHGCWISKYLCRSLQA